MKNKRHKRKKIVLKVTKVTPTRQNHYYEEKIVEMLNVLTNMINARVVSNIDDGDKTLIRVARELDLLLSMLKRGDSDA